MKRNPNKGLFITFEGGEGSGKTTLLDKIYHALKELGVDVIKTRAPGGTPLGVSIRSLLLHHQHMKICERSEILLFLADRSQHVKEVILPALQEGKIVLCDRFTDSTIAYQLGARKIHHETQTVRSCHEEHTPDEKQWLKDLCNFGCYGLKPDLTFFLSIDPKIGLSRAKSAILREGKEAFDRLESETLKFHENVYNQYVTLSHEEPERIITLDAKKSAQDVFLDAKSILLSILER